MGILNVLFHNSRRTSRTRQPVDHVAFPAGFRGTLDHQTDQCVGCATCQYVCSPGAIQLPDSALSGITWEYRTAQCTFCGKCVEYCPTKALSFDGSAPAVINAPSMVTHRVEYHPCPDCGQKFAPLPVPTIERLYGHVPKTIYKLMQLCEKCRNRATVEIFKESLSGELHLSGGEQ